MRSQLPADLGPFRTSSYSGGGSCVEVARAPDGTVVVQDTKDAQRSTSLVFDRAEWRAFVLGVRDGEFDV